MRAFLLDYHGPRAADDMSREGRVRSRRRSISADLAEVQDTARREAEKDGRALGAWRPAAGARGAGKWEAACTDSDGTEHQTSPTLG
jgi:hypothetical protein